MATRASNNHISGSGVGSKKKHKLSGVTVLRKLSVNVDRSYKGAARKILDHLRSNCFLKIDTEGDKTKCAGSLFQYFTTQTENAPLLRRRRLGPSSNRYVCPHCPARGGRRKNSGWLRSTSPMCIRTTDISQIRLKSVAENFPLFFLYIPFKSVHF